jgi:hypothetical protein
MLSDTYVQEFEKTAVSALIKVAKVTGDVFGTIEEARGLGETLGQTRKQMSALPGDVRKSLGRIEEGYKKVPQTFGRIATGVEAASQKASDIKESVSGLPKKLLGGGAIGLPLILMMLMGGGRGGGGGFFGGGGAQRYQGDPDRWMA